MAAGDSSCLGRRGSGDVCTWHSEPHRGIEVVIRGGNYCRASWPTAHLTMPDNEGAAKAVQSVARVGTCV